MAIGLVTDEGSLFVEKEVTEGTYVPESASASAIEVLSDGLEFTPSKELLERNNRTSTVEQVAARVGQKSMATTIPVEFKAHQTEGQAPETDALYEALLGGKRAYVSRTSLTGHTTTTITLAVGEAAQYAVGDIVKIKEYDLNSANEDHVSPITDITGDVITLLIPYFQAFSDNVVVAAGTTYFHQTGAPTLSCTQYIGGEIREKAIGMRAVSGELGAFETGALPTMSFSLEGLDYDREVGTPLFTPAFDTSLPPVVLCAKVFKDSTEIVVNSVGITMTNSLGFLTSTASCNGKISSRITDFSCTFSIDPYMDDSNVDNFNLFDNNTAFSIFGSAYNPGAAKEEHLENVAYYMPSCRFTEIKTGDADGVVKDELAGSAYKTNSNDTVFLSFI